MIKNCSFLMLWLATFIVACNNNSEIKDVDLSKTPNITCTVERLDSVIFNIKSEPEMLAFLNKNQDVCRDYFLVEPNDFPVLAKKLLSYGNNASLVEFYKTSVANEIYIKLDSLKNELNQAFRHIKYYYPSFRTPKVYTFFTGFLGKDLVVNEAYICIGLDYYLGKKAPFRPNLNNYQLFKFQPNFIVTNIINLYSAKYNAANGSDKTLLADMLYYGKAMAFTKTIVPTAPDSIILGITQSKLEETELSQEMVWGHFIDEKLLYETSEFKKSKYLDERPNTTEISPDCPGMIGRWLGWKIINKFQENNDEGLQSMMANTNAQQIFEKSKYKGKADVE